MAPDAIANHSSRMFEAGVRLEKLLWIPGNVACPSEEFDDFINDEACNAPDLVKLFPFLGLGSEGEDVDAEYIAGEFAARGIDGFFAQMARPVPHFFDARAYDSSWGYYRLKWVYVKTIDDLCLEAEAWSTEIVEKARAAYKQPEQSDAQ